VEITWGIGYPGGEILGTETLVIKSNGELVE
jgi:hypothetical protein